MKIVYQIIYNSTVNWILRNLNKILLPLLPEKIKIPPSGILNITTDSGNLKIATNQTNYITQLLFWNGYKNFEYSTIFEVLAKKAQCFLDIGSHVGYYSLLAVNSNPEIITYAFEPASGPKHFLNKNIALNNFQNNINPIDIALSNKNGDIDFYEVGNIKYKYLKYNLAGEGNTGTKTTSRNFIKNTVKTTTLNDFVATRSIENIDLIKIDTEGTEIDILKSGKNIININKPIIICETLFNTIENELDDFFNELDYEFYNHTAQGLKKVSSIKRNTDNGIRNCFFVPKSKSALISQFVI